MFSFTVPDMTCGGCARGVTRAIKGVDAGASVETDPPGREVRVDNATVEEGALLAALAKAGFPATRRLAPPPAL